MLTPALATGAAAGTLLVLIINAVVGTQYHVPAVSMAGAAGVLAITQRAPFWAAIFVWGTRSASAVAAAGFPGRRLERLRLAASRRAWPGLERA